MIEDKSNKTEQRDDRSEYAVIADELKALAIKNDNASSLREKARAEADLEDYCYNNLSKIIAGLYLAAKALKRPSRHHQQG